MVYALFLTRNGTLMRLLVSAFMAAAALAACGPNPASFPETRYGDTLPRGASAETEITVRALKGNQDVDASCSVTGRGYSVSAVTPARIIVPLYRRASDQATVTCTFEGESTTQAITTINLTARDLAAAEQALAECRSRPSSSIGASSYCHGTLSKRVADLRGIGPEAQEYGYGEVTITF